MEKKKNIEQEIIITKWEQIVGDKIAKQCKPKNIDGGVLYIKAKDNIWREELAIRHDELLNLLNNKLKSSHIKKIRFI